MPIVTLPDRALVTVSGPEAEHFLQNLVTTDLAGLAQGEVKPGALLTPQGKILFDFLISHAADGGFLIECRADVVDDFIRRLTLYRLRARVEIRKQDQSLVSVSWGSDSSYAATLPKSGGLTDTRFAAPAIVKRLYGLNAPASAAAADWHRFRIASGVPESGEDYALGDAFPHDVLLDQTGGVGMRKGCYVGQEVVSRMQHRGTARRRFLIARSDRALPATGTEITAGGRSVGALGSVAGESGLALVRIDKIKAAMDARQPIVAGDAELSLSIPSWARFEFPRDAAAEEA
jgi:folate-binding protein YgfZ